MQKLQCSHWEAGRRGWGGQRGVGSAHIWIHQHAGPAWPAPPAPSLGLPASLQQGAACGVAPACPPAPAVVQAGIAQSLAQRTEQGGLQAFVTQHLPHHSIMATMQVPTHGTSQSQAEDSVLALLSTAV